MLLVHGVFYTNNGQSVLVVPGKAALQTLVAAVCPEEACGPK